MVEKRHFTYRQKSLNGDFNMEYSLKLDTVNIQDFYSRVEEQITKQVRDSISSVYRNVDESGNYHFNSSGINPLTHETLDLQINKRNSVVKVNIGSW